ncbi:hypothetical protein [Nocardioides acrostichi]|uniref:Uncharacterized protein n=1 Tax=Nocardioides acrostichi TaxID=2784339 RepID=A0A930V2H2_9ACTN|nr:hypothetical protein [Nocardioides acrostichi]MBF4162587.1 hypothetical protein [Nocardioides acrostichi]
MTQDLRYTEPDSRGNVSWRLPIANIRPIPDITKNYPEVMGTRNQSESFFSWAEKRYYRHDLAASWGRDAQVFDLIALALLHNSEAWAHLAYRHPSHAEEFRAILAAMDPPDLSGVKKKPLEQRKAAQAAHLRTLEAWLPVTSTADSRASITPVQTVPAATSAPASLTAGRTTDVERQTLQHGPIKTLRAPRTG